ncbi:MAG: hypothetical protein KBT00_06245 [Bacteroidales bacterium]|nr:hypothetical protein [Candidatus Cacconaster merdequi]
MKKNSIKVLFLTAEDTEMEACHRASLESGVEADCFFSGMGAEATRRKMDGLELEDYDYVIDVGIAGTYVGAPLGSAFNIVEERHGEHPSTKYTGAETLFPWLPSAKGLTYQTMISDRRTVEARRALGAEIESMEGAAFFEVCIERGVRHFAELRSVSNEVGETDRGKWNQPLALDALYEACRKFLSQLPE